MPRARGGRSVTTLPPMRTSPRVGSSSPAIIRRSVDFPDPEGPRKTRNSPSAMTRSTSLTAPSSPFFKTLVSFLVSTTATSRPRRSLPLVEDALQLLLRRLRRVLRRRLVARHPGEHGGKDEGVERLVDRGGGVARVADVRRPLEDVPEHLVLVRRLRLRVVRDLLGDVRDRRREAGEVVELALLEGFAEGVDVVDEELLRPLLVLGEVPDGVAVHHVLGREPVGRPLERGHELDLLRHLRVFLLGGARHRDGVEDEGELAGQDAAVVRRRIPGEDLVRLRLLEQRAHELQRLDRLRRRRTRSSPG